MGGLRLARARKRRGSRAVLPLVDWVGFDVKAPFAECERITGVRASGARAAESLRLLVESGLAFETRTPLHPALLDADALARMRSEAAALRIAPPRIQPFRGRMQGRRARRVRMPARNQAETQLRPQARGGRVRS